MPWYLIKALAAHLADWGFQTTSQAVHKAHCSKHRARHCAIVALSHALAAATSDQKSVGRKVAYVGVNAVTHFAIDSYRLPKWLDQVLHVTVALLSARLLKK